MVDFVEVFEMAVVDDYAYRKRRIGIRYDVTDGVCYGIG